MNKPKYIEAKYESFLTWDLDELGINYNDIEDYQINHTSLVVEFKDGTTKEYDNWGSEVDYKHGYIGVNAFDKDWEKVSDE
jgi:hypothetical protein